MKKSVTIISVAAAGAVAITGIVTGTESNLASAFGPEREVSRSDVLPGDQPRKWPRPRPSRPTASWPTVRPTRPPATTPAPSQTPSETPTETPSGTPSETPTGTPSNTPRPTTSPSQPPAPPPGSFPAGPSEAPACHGVTIAPGQEAASVVDQHPAGTTFCFTAGVHRIGRTIHPKPNSTLGSDEGAVLTGSVRLTDWSGTGGDWVTKGALPGAYGQTGQCEDNSANICYLREQVFLDGKHLKRVSSRDKVAAGTFYADYDSNAIYLGDDPRDRAVEMSKTSTAIEARATGVTVRGLTVEHFASAPQAGAVVLSKDWTVFANEIRWNHAVGAMLVNADGATLEKNLIHHNGQLGVGQYKSSDGSIVGNEISHNNTDGFWIADWESGGIKTTWSSGGEVSGNLIKENLGVGLWSDAYDDGRLFSDNHIVGNAADGIRFEIGRNGVIEDNTITGNGFGTGRNSGSSLWDGGGINVNTSTNVTVRDNTVAGNVNGISIQSRTRGNGPWGLNLLRRVVVSGNKVTMRGGSQSTGMVQNSGAEIPLGEVVLRDNEYVLDSLTADRFQKFGQWFNATEWQRAGHDAGSRFTTG